MNWFLLLPYGLILLGVLMVVGGFIITIEEKKKGEKIEKLTTAIFDLFNSWDLHERDNNK